MKPFRGSGGLLGGSSSQPTNTPDNLRSSDQVEVILGLCQGPIKGLTNGYQSFYLGSTPYQNADGTFNFTLFDLDIDPGETPGTPIIPVLGGFEDWRPIGTSLVLNTPQSFITPYSALTQIIVRLNVLKLYMAGTDAQLASLPGAWDTFSTFLPRTMSVSITYQSYPGGAVINPFGGPVEITGKTQVGEPHEIRFIPTGNGPYQVWVELLTYDDGNQNICQVNLDGFFEVTGGYFGFARSDNINVLMATGVTVTRTTQYPNARPDGTVGIDFIATRIVVNQLYEQDTDGSTYNDAVDLLIQFKRTSTTSWVNPFGGVVTISGKTTTTPAVMEYRWPVTPVADTYDVSVTIASADEANHYRSLTWESMQEIVGGPATFDGLATAHLSGQSSDQFSSVPTMWGIYDLLLCQIPSNYDPYGRTYTGAWDGTFKTDWTSNPAWCLYNLAMNATWGAVSYWPNFSLDKYDCYTAGQWCDTMVPDGQGGLQPRYTFNGLIDTPRGIRDQLRYMAGTFNGTFLDDLNGNVRVVFDANEEAVALFTRENVIDGLFEYSYTDESTRYNYFTGTYNEPNLQYQAVPMVVTSPEDIARYGMTPTNIILVGCADGHEALRRLTYQMISATTETEIVSFRTNRAGLMLRPFNPILIADPDMANSVTGRIKSLDATRMVVYLRDPITLELGVIYTFRTFGTNPDYPATSSDPLSITEIPFGAPLNGATLAIELSIPLSAEVANDAPFSIGAEGTSIGVPKAYRVTSIEPQDGDPDNVVIQAIEINRNKQTLSDNANNQVGYSTFYLPSDIQPPTNLSVSTDIISVNGALIANVVANWVAAADPRVVSYNLRYRRSGDTEWTPARVTTTIHAEIYNVPNGTYDFGVQSVAMNANVSAWVYQYQVNAGLDVPPDDVSFLTLSLLGTVLTLSWPPVTALNLSYYWVRYSPITDSTATWESSTDLVQQVYATQINVPAIAGTYFVKAVNTSGIASVNAASATTLTSGLGINLVDNEEQSTTWPGTKTNMTVNGFGLLVMSTAGGNTSGSYVWTSTDLGDVYTCRISLAMLATASLVGSDIAQWDKLTDVTTLSGVAPSDYSVISEIALSQDGSTFAAFQPFATGEWTGRQFQFRISVSSNIPNVQPQLSQCAAVIGMPERLIRGTNVFVPTPSLTVTFSPPFHIVPAIIVAVKGGASGDYFSITSETNAGFTITCYNSAGTAVTRYIDYLAAGYGDRG